MTKSFNNRNVKNEISDIDFGPEDHEEVLNDFEFHNI